MFGLKSIVSFVTIAALAGVSAAPAAELDTRVTRWGQATYFAVGLGACGWNNVDSDWIVALNSEVFQKNGGSNCGQSVRITNQKNGKTAVAQVADECPTCDGGSLDLSPSLFAFLGDGDMDQGVFPISWNFKKRS